MDGWTIVVVGYGMNILLLALVYNSRKMEGKSGYGRNVLLELVVHVHENN